MKLETAVRYRSRTYASEDHPDQSIRPQLIINFQLPSSGIGLESAMIFENLKPGREFYANTNYGNYPWIQAWVPDCCGFS